MHIGIDAANIRAGGGVTHLVQLLSHFDPYSLGIKKVTIWAGKGLRSVLPNVSWLRLAHQPILDRSLPWRLWWQKTHLPRQLVKDHCDVLFAPGGIVLGRMPCPLVAMSQSLIPFEPKEIKRYRFSPMRARLEALYFLQRFTLESAHGVIFLSQYARGQVEDRAGVRIKRGITIPHGIDDRFRKEPRIQDKAEAYSLKKPYRLLYVSIIDEYKHQWNVAEAAAQLRSAGIFVAVDFVGGAYKPSLKKFMQSLKRWDKNGEYLRYCPELPHADLAQVYSRADGFVFASSCETISIILLEAMASGLPIACSNRGPMPEILGDGGIYFNPENVQEIVQTLKALITDSEKRRQIAWAAYEQSLLYSWERCAQETFSFIKDVAKSASLCNV